VQSKPDLTHFLGKHVYVHVDRPLGSRHPQHPDIIYGVNYGCIPWTFSADGMPVDAYLLGVDEPVAHAEGVVIAVIVRDDDLEDKLVVSTGTHSFSEPEIREAAAFQERFFDSHIVTPEKMSTRGETSVSRYRHLEEKPDLVRSALQLADSIGFTHSCSDETGRLLRLLASQVRVGTIAEIGTGCGVGSAWIAGALFPSVRLVTIELDEIRSSATSRLLARVPAVTVLSGDWHGLKSFAPFAMLFADGGKVTENNPAELIEIVQPGGLIIMDDLTPLEQWPREWWGKPDLVREFWLNDRRVIATEVQVSPTSSVLLATRTGN
jgi:predicted O-methyltransferase YrrM